MFQGQNIQVFVRCRPLNSHERRSVVEVLPHRREIKVLDRNINKNFYFDQVFASDAKQNEIYRTVVQPLIDQVLLGFNCTVFAYGQTGTGKTYTMEGDRSEDRDLSWEEDPHCGIIPRAVSQLFDTLKSNDNEFTVRVSFLELYNEDTYDLLSPLDDTAKLKVFDDSQRKGSVIVGGLAELTVQSKAEIYEILKRGSAKRQTAATLLNACSSRSHTIFSVTVHIREGSIEGEELLKIGKLNLVDLAGSENIGRSGAQDKRAREAGNINQSLLTLGRVITALVEKRPHIPYRESKLTRLLQDSLGGKTKTSIIATISPAFVDTDDTLSTLDYASRAKKITNQPEMNQRLTKKALLSEYENEIKRLRKDLKATREKCGVYMDEESYQELCKSQEAYLALMQEENDKQRKLFEDSEKTKAELGKTKEQCEKQEKIILAQKEAEKALEAHSVELAQVAENITNDNYLLHCKKERIETVLKENRASIERYHPEVKDDINRLQSLVEISLQDQITSNLTDEKVLRDVESSLQTVRQLGEVNKTMAEQLVAQSAFHKAQAEDVKSQVAQTSKTVKNLESMLKESHTQLKHQLSQIDSHLKLARELEGHAENLKRGEYALSSVNRIISGFKSTAQENDGRLKQVTSTLKSSMKRECGALQRKFERFFIREIKEDIKTGLTPQKKTYNIPRLHVQTPTCDSILEDVEGPQHQFSQ